MVQFNYVAPDTTEPIKVDVPPQFADSNENAALWIEDNYIPYVDSGLEAASEDTDHPLSMLPKSFARGFYQLGKAWNATQLKLNWDNPTNAARDLNKFHGYLEKVPYDKDTLETLVRLHDAKDAGEVWDIIVDSPGSTMDAVLDVTFESMAQFSPVLATGIAAGVITKSRPLMAAISGLGSFGIEYGNSVMEAMEEFLRKEYNSDLSNERLVAQILGNEQKMAEFESFAVDRAWPIGLVDGLSMGFAGMLVTAVRRAKKAADTATKAQKALKRVPTSAAAAVEALGIQPTAGALGEYLAQLSADQDFMAGDIFLEFAGELLPGSGQVGLGVLIDYHKDLKKTEGVEEDKVAKEREGLKKEKEKQRQEKIKQDAEALKKRIREAPLKKELDIVTDDLVGKAEVEGVRQADRYVNRLLNYTGQPIKEGDKLVDKAGIKNIFGLKNKQSVDTIINHLEKEGLIRRPKGSPGGWHGSGNQRELRYQGVYYWTKKAQERQKVSLVGGVIPETLSLDETAHSTELPEELEGIAKDGLNVGSSVESASDMAFASGTFRLIFEGPPKGERVDTLDIPFTQITEQLPPENIKRIEVLVENLPAKPLTEKQYNKQFDAIVKEIKTRIPDFDPDNSAYWSNLFTTEDPELRRYGNQIERRMEALEASTAPQQIHQGNYKKYLKGVFGKEVEIIPQQLDEESGELIPYPTLPTLPEEAVAPPVTAVEEEVVVEEAPPVTAVEEEVVVEEAPPVAAVEEEVVVEEAPPVAAVEEEAAEAAAEAERQAEYAREDADSQAKKDFERIEKALEEVSREGGLMAMSGAENAFDTLAEDPTLVKDSARYWNLAIASIESVADFGLPENAEIQDVYYKELEAIRQAAPPVAAVEGPRGVAPAADEIVEDEDLFQEALQFHTVTSDYRDVWNKVRKAVGEAHPKGDMLIAAAEDNTSEMFVNEDSSAREIWLDLVNKFKRVKDVEWKKEDYTFSAPYFKQLIGSTDFLINEPEALRHLLGEEVVTLKGDVITLNVTDKEINKIKKAFEKANTLSSVNVPIAIKRQLEGYPADAGVVAEEAPTVTDKLTRLTPAGHPFHEYAYKGWGITAIPNANETKIDHWNITDPSGLTADFTNTRNEAQKLVDRLIKQEAKYVKEQATYEIEEGPAIEAARKTLYDPTAPEVHELVKEATGEYTYRGYNISHIIPEKGRGWWDFKSEENQGQADTLKASKEEIDLFEDERGIAEWTEPTVVEEVITEEEASTQDKIIKYMELRKAEPLPPLHPRQSVLDGTGPSAVREWSTIVEEVRHIFGEDAVVFAESYLFNEKFVARPSETRSFIPVPPDDPTDITTVIDMDRETERQVSRPVTVSDEMLTYLMDSIPHDQKEKFKDFKLIDRPISDPLSTKFNEDYISISQKISRIITPSPDIDMDERIMNAAYLNSQPEIIKILNTAISSTTTEELEKHKQEAIKQREGDSLLKMMEGTWANSLVVFHPNRMAEKWPDLLGPFYNSLLYRRESREQKQQLWFRLVDKFYRNTSSKDNEKLSKASVALDAFANKFAQVLTNEDVKELPDGGLSITIPVEVPEKTVKDAEGNEYTEPVIDVDLYDNFLKANGFSKGEVITLNEENVEKFKDTQKTFRRVYDDITIALVHHLLQKFPLSDNLPSDERRMEGDEFVSTSFAPEDSTYDTKQKIAQSVEAYIEEIVESLPIKDGETVPTKTVKDEKGKKTEVPIVDFTTLDLDISSVTPRSDLFNDILELTKSPMYTAKKADGTFVNEIFVNKVRNVLAQLNTIKIINDQFTTLQQHPFYVPRLRLGDYFFTIKEKNTKKLVYFETSNPTFFDTLINIARPLSEPAQRRRLEKRHKELKGIYWDEEKWDVGSISRRTLDPIKKQLDQRDINLIEAFADTLGYGLNNPSYGHQSAEAVQAFITDLGNQVTSSGFNSYLKQRSPQLIGGYYTPNNRINFLSATLSDYIRTGADTASNLEYWNPLTASITRIRARNPDVADVAQRLLDDINNPNEPAAQLRSLAFVYALGWNLSSPVVNSSQPFVTTIPFLTGIVGHRQVGVVTKEVLKGIADAYRMFKFIGRLDTYGFRFDEKDLPSQYSSFLTQEEWEMLREYYSRGINQPVVNIDLGARYKRAVGEVSAFANPKVGDMFAAIMDAGAFLFGGAEQINRIASALAAFRLAKRPGNTAKFAKFAKTTGVAAQVEMTPHEAARMTVYKTQYLISKENRPQLFRNAWGSVATQFMSFQMQYVGMYSHILGQVMKVDKRTGALMISGLMLSMMFFGGMMGLPFMDNLRQAIAKLTSQVWDDYEWDLEAATREILADAEFNPTIINMFMRGTFSELTGVDLSRRIGTGEMIPFDLLMGDLKVTTGPFGSLLWDSITRAKEGWKTDNLSMLLTSAVPLGFRYAVEGGTSLFDKSIPIRTTQGRVLMPGKEVSYWDNIIRTLGFTPKGISDRRRAVSYAKYLKRRPRSLQDKYLRDLSRHLVNAQMAYDKGEMVKYHEIMIDLEKAFIDLEEVNREALESGKISDVIKIDRRTLKRRMMIEMLGSSSVEGIRQSASKLVQTGLPIERLKALGFR